MSKNKPLVLCLILFFVSGAAFSQVSKTNSATGGLFSTDVDNYMSVNGWSSVDLYGSNKNAAIFTDLNSNALSLGFAKNIGSVFLGMYFNGSLPHFVNASYAGGYFQFDITAWGYCDPTVPRDKWKNLESKSEYPSVSTEENKFEAAVLFGFGNIGAKLGAIYSPSNYYAKITYTNGSPTEEFAADSKELTPYLELGLDLDRFTPYAQFSYGMLKEETVYKKNTSYEKTFKDYDSLNTKIGSGFDFDQDGSYTQKLGAEAAYSYYLYPTYSKDTNGTLTTQSINKHKADLTLSYKGEYFVDDETSFGFKTSLPVKFNYTNSVVSSSASVEINVSTEPELSVGLTHVLVPEKLTFNAGTVLAMGNLVSFDYSKDSLKSEVNLSVLGGTYTTTFTAGLCWNLTDGITLDTCFNIANETSTGTSIWSTGAIGVQAEFRL